MNDPKYLKAGLDDAKSVCVDVIEPKGTKPDMGRIQNWRRVDAYGGLGYVIVGRFLDHTRLMGSNSAHTSYVVKHDEKTGAVETRNSLYTLVGPESFKDAGMTMTDNRLEAAQDAVALRDALWQPIETAPTGRILLGWKAFAGIDEHVELGQKRFGGFVNTYGHPFSGYPDCWMAMPKIAARAALEMSGGVKS